MVRTWLLASVSCALPRWLRKAGRAIAARMPMIRMTTRSSIRVKPFSSWARWRSLLSIWWTLLKRSLGLFALLARSVVRQPQWSLDPVAARLTHPELRGFASRPRGRFAFSTLVLARTVSAGPTRDLTPAEEAFVHAASIGGVLGRRLLVLFAVLLGLTALVTSLAPRPTVTRPGVAQVTPNPTATPAPTRRATTSRRIVKSISADPGSPRTRIHARVGDVLVLTLRGDVLAGVEIEAAGKLEPIEPGSP